MFCPEMSFTEVLKDNKCSLIEAMVVFTSLKCCLNCLPGSNNIKTWLLAASESNHFKCDSHVLILA